MYNKSGGYPDHRKWWVYFWEEQKVQGKNGLPPLIQSRKLVQSDVHFIDVLSSEQDIANTVEIQYVKDNEMTSKRRQQQKSKRKWIVKKKSKAMFTGAIVEGELTLWFNRRLMSYPL